MTRFERDLKEVREGNEVEVITKRKAEIAKLIKEGKACKNSFRRECIAQEVANLQNELNQIDELF